MSTETTVAFSVASSETFAESLFAAAAASPFFASVSGWLLHPVAQSPASLAVASPQSRLIGERRPDAGHELSVMRLGERAR